MSYQTKAVANWIIEKSNFQCTQIGLNILVYIAHGWYLAICGNNLISEPAIAWKYGPVIPTLRQEFKEWGSCPITRYASTWVDIQQYHTPMLVESNMPKWEITLLNWIWDAYGCLTDTQLIATTIQDNSPWNIISKTGRNQIIPNVLIETYYQELFKKIKDNNV